MRVRGLSVSFQRASYTVLRLWRRRFRRTAARCQQMKHHASDLMGRSRYGLWRSKFGAHAGIVLSERTVAMMQRVRSKPKRLGGTVIDFSGACPQDLASADVI